MQRRPFLGQASEHRAQLADNFALCALSGQSPASLPDKGVFLCCAAQRWLVVSSHGVLSITTEANKAVGLSNVLGAVQMIPFWIPLLSTRMQLHTVFLPF